MLVGLRGRISEYLFHNKTSRIKHFVQVGSDFTIQIRVLIKTIVSPAIHAVMKQAALPATKARKATCAKSDCRSGAMVDNAAICVPIDPGLEKPHNAYVAIVSALFYESRSQTNVTFFQIRPFSNNYTEMMPCAMYSDNLLYAANSLTIVLSATRFATRSHSAAGTPINQATGMKILPIIYYMKIIVINWTC